MTSSFCLCKQILLIFLKWKIYISPIEYLVTLSNMTLDVCNVSETLLEGGL